MKILEATGKQALGHSTLLHLDANESKVFAASPSIASLEKRVENIEQPLIIRRIVPPEKAFATYV